MTKRTPRRTRALASSGLALLLLAGACGADSETITDDPGNGALDPVPAVPIRLAGDANSGLGGNGPASVAAESDDIGSAMLAPWWIADYVLADGLGPVASEATGWRYVASGDPTAAKVDLLLAALGMEGTLEATGGGWQVGPDDGSAPTLSISADGPQSWWYSPGWQTGDGVVRVGCAEPGTAPVDVDVPAIEPVPGEATEPGGGAHDTAVPVEPEEADALAEEFPALECEYEAPTPPANVPSASEAEAKAAALLQTLGVDITSAEVTTWADEWSAQVTVSPRLGTVLSPMGWSFGFGAEGLLDWASGNLATPEAVGPYPLVSLEDAVQRLRDGFGGWNGGVVGDPVPLGDVAVSIAAVPAEDGDEAPDREPVVSEDEPLGEPMEPEAITVTLVGVDLALWWAWDVDGTAWLLPAYEFTDADGGTHLVPAVTDEYLIEAPIAIADDPPTLVEPPEAGNAGSDPVGEGDAIADEELAELLGLTEDEASAVASERGWAVRVVERDGEAFDVRDDYSTSRVNLVVAEGLVTEVTVG